MVVMFTVAATVYISTRAHIGMYVVNELNEEKQITQRKNEKENE